MKVIRNKPYLISNIEKAEEILAKHFRVFPVIPSTKMPATGEGGFHNATRDIEQVKKWAKENPKNLMGIPMDIATCLDLDCSDEQKSKLNDPKKVFNEVPLGIQNWADKVPGGKEFLMEHTDKLLGTQNNGRHLYCYPIGNLKNKGNIAGLQCVDTRTNNDGYVVAYEGVEEKLGNLVEVPKSIKTWLVQNDTRKQQQSTTHTSTSRADQPYTIRKLDQMIADAATIPAGGKAGDTKGGRNDHSTHIIYFAVSNGLDKEMVREKLYEAMRQNGSFDRDGHGWFDASWAGAEKNPGDPMTRSRQYHEYEEDADYKESSAGSHIEPADPQSREKNDKTCGDKGGRTQNGHPCNVFKGLDSDGRCISHPKHRDDKHIARIIKKDINAVIDKYIREELIFYAESKNTYNNIFYIKKNGIWHLLYGDKTKNSIAREVITVGDNIVDSSKNRKSIKEELMHILDDRVDDGDIKRVDTTSMDKRINGIYRIENDIFSFKNNRKIKVANRYNYTNQFPRLYINTKKSCHTTDRFIASFGDGFIKYLAQILGIPSKSLFAMLGESNSGKSVLPEIINEAFVEGKGVAFHKAKDLIQNSVFDNVSASLTECLITKIDEIEQIDSKHLSVVIEILGTDTMPVEKKYEHPMQKPRISNGWFISNRPFGADTSETEVKNRITEGSVWVVGIPSLDKYKRQYRKHYRSKRDAPMDDLQYEIMLEDCTKIIKPFNKDYRQPFGMMTNIQWENIKNTMKQNAGYLVEQLLKEASIEHQITDREMAYLEYFNRVADLKRMADGYLDEPSEWMEKEYGYIARRRGTWNDNNKDIDTETGKNNEKEKQNTQKKEPKLNLPEAIPMP